MPNPNNEAVLDADIRFDHAKDRIKDQRIGDDQIQRRTAGYVVPDSFTHGTSEQRLRWFKKGYDTGDIRQGDTFGTRNL